MDVRVGAAALALTAAAALVPAGMTDAGAAPVVGMVVVPTTVVYEQVFTVSGSECPTAALLSIDGPGGVKPQNSQGMAGADAQGNWSWKFSILGPDSGYDYPLGQYTIHGECAAAAGATAEGTSGPAQTFSGFQYEDATVTLVAAATTTTTTAPSTATTATTAAPATEAATALGGQPAFTG